MRKLKTKKTLLDYIDEDVAYLIGLIVARGGDIRARRGEEDFHRIPI